MARKKLSTTVYLEPWQVEALRTMSSRAGTPMARMIREAIAAYIEACMSAVEIEAMRRARESEIATLRARLAELETPVEGIPPGFRELTPLIAELEIEGADAR